MQILRSYLATYCARRVTNESSLLLLMVGALCCYTFDGKLGMLAVDLSRGFTVVDVANVA